jgi:cytidine deaminase
VNHDDLIAAAVAAAANAYAPYSKFRVGAAVMTSDGEVFTGANVENAAYPSGICGEATAINTAAAAGSRKLDVVVVACIDASDIEDAYPCGRCRQVMAEFDIERVLVTNDGSVVVEHTLDELLPHRFKM